MDNGNTLTDHAFPEFVRYIPNKNCGGAGGFTRGMLEAVKLKKFTHVILMDDDIFLEPEVLERTRCFLSVLKKEYEDAELAGSLLRKVFHGNSLNVGQTGTGGGSKLTEKALIFVTGIPCWRMQKRTVRSMAAGGIAAFL